MYRYKYDARETRVTNGRIEREIERAEANLGMNQLTLQGDSLYIYIFTR